MKDFDLYNHIIALDPGIDIGFRWLVTSGQKSLFKLIICAAYRQGQVDRINAEVMRMDKEASQS